MNKKYTKSKIFDDLTLAYGLIKRMNGFAFSKTGDDELKRLGFMLVTDPKMYNLKPYITAKGKKFLMEVIKPLAEEVEEDKPELDGKKDKVDKLVKNMQEKPSRAYFEPDEDEDDEDEDDYENDSES